MKGGVARQALYTPDDQFKGSLTYATGFGLTVAATALYVGFRPGHYTSDTDVTPTKTLPHYWTADLKLEQRLYNHWIITLQANNLFDKGYETYADNFYDSTGTSTMSSYPGAGRSVFANVAYEF
jgi:iron complex outermembrane receptor protein